MEDVRMWRMREDTRPGLEVRWSGSRAAGECDVLAPDAEGGIETTAVGRRERESTSTSEAPTEARPNDAPRAARSSQLMERDASSRRATACQKRKVGGAAASSRDAISSHPTNGAQK